MNIIMVAGGTGGHIYPALALADKLVEYHHNVTFMGSSSRMESNIIPSHNYPFIGLNIKNYAGVKGRFKTLWNLVKVQKEVKELFRKAKPDLVIGFGNYISVPVILAAKSLHIKTIIHEQNSQFGKANLFLARFVDLVIGSYPENVKQCSKTKVLGNPRGSKLYEYPKDVSCLKDYGLDPNKKTVLFVMGSLGSSSVNEHMLEVLKELEHEEFQVLYVTGEKGYDAFIEKYQGNSRIKVVKYIDGLKVMKSVDLIVCRAGATTLSEITACGLASITIPSPYVPGNHQYYNAMALHHKQASICVLEKELQKDILANLIKELIYDDLRLEKLKRNALKFGYPCAINDIIDEINKVTKVK